MQSDASSGVPAKQARGKPVIVNGKVRYLGEDGVLRDDETEAAATAPPPKWRTTFMGMEWTVRRIYLVACVLTFVALCRYARDVRWAAVFACVALCGLTFLSTGKRRPGELSAYSWFNPGFAKLAGQLTTADFEAQLRGGVAAPGASSRGVGYSRTLEGPANPMAHDDLQGLGKTPEGVVLGSTSSSSSSSGGGGGMRRRFIPGYGEVEVRGGAGAAGSSASSRATTGATQVMSPPQTAADAGAGGASGRGSSSAATWAGHEEEEAEAAVVAADEAALAEALARSLKEQ